MARLRAVFVCAALLLACPAIAGEGHAAGYRWALDKGIDDPFRCEGKSPSLLPRRERSTPKAAGEE